jgi:hypothetical protein
MHRNMDGLKAMEPAMEDTKTVNAFKDCLRKYQYGRTDLSQSAQELYTAVQESIG